MSRSEPTTIPKIANETSVSKRDNRSIPALRNAEIAKPNANTANGIAIMWACRSAYKNVKNGNSVIFVAARPVFEYPRAPPIVETREIHLR